MDSFIRIVSGEWLLGREAALILYHSPAGIKPKPAALVRGSGMARHFQISTAFD
jgi:hypothetical protein